MRVDVRVKPGSKKGPMVRPNLIDDSLVVYVREPAVDGKASKAVIELLADFYEVPKSYIKITRGLSSRNKVIEVTKG